MSISNSLYRNFISGFILLLFSISGSGQSLDELQKINTVAKAQYVQPETLDQLMIRLRPFIEQPVVGQDTLLMETFTVIANNYTANNHFKQAYTVYNQYLDYKQNYLIKEKNKAIASGNGSVGTRRDKEEAELVDLQSQVRQLEIDIDELGSKRSGFKRYFSIALITLSAILAAMLVSSGVKLNNMRSRLKQNRERMKEIHRVASIGLISQGITSGIKANMISLSESITVLIQQFQKTGEHDPEAKQVIARLTEAKKLLNQTQQSR